MNKKIEDIVYQTTRELHNVEAKLRIATLFLFCNSLGSKELSELLYCENKEKFISELENKYKEYEIDIVIDFTNKNVENSFYKTLEEVKRQWDENSFLKALYDGDEFAIVINNMVNNEFDKLLFSSRKSKLKESIVGDKNV